MSAEEIKPSSPKTEVTAEETANAEPEEVFRPSSEGKDVSFKQTENVFFHIYIMYICIFLLKCYYRF